MLELQWNGMMLILLHVSTSYQKLRREFGVFRTLSHHWVRTIIPDIGFRYYHIYRTVPFLQHSPTSCPAAHHRRWTLSSIRLMRSSNRFRCNASVNTSAMLSSVATYSTTTFRAATASRMKWYLMSMCLVRPWNLSSFDNAIDPWL